MFACISSTALSQVEITAQLAFAQAVIVLDFLLFVEGDAVTIEDLGSTNGTFVNDQPTREAQLFPGQRIRLGEIGMQLVRRAPQKPRRSMTAVNATGYGKKKPVHPSDLESYR